MRSGCEREISVETNSCEIKLLRIRFLNHLLLVPQVVGAKQD